MAYTITDNTLLPGWVKTVSPFTNTSAPGSSVSYPTQAAAQADAATLNADPILSPTGNRFAWGTRPK